MAKQLTGTWEWAGRTVNCCLGCRNQCIYCYGCAMAVMFRSFDPSKWKNEAIVEKALTAKLPVDNQMVMFPSTHDISPENLPSHIKFIGRLLEAYPRVLIVSKPHLKCVRAICKTFKSRRDQILFRFTIGSTDSKVLKFWEPGAPSFKERLACLKLAHSLGFETSVSMEPMLDNNPEAVVKAIKPYVTETVWLGKANRLKQRLSTNGHKDIKTMARADELLEWQSDANIHTLYQRLKDDPQIRWKDSIKKVVGLEGPK
ncbi:MAG: hypothetical protein A2509_12300 [Candidatus Edwardsbacteria bacterium RIFOXYD12_FULL_50_11]|uniref:Radical SAM core domain-containing protein n=1 Tax=Candidatus Edwardsbacteria bacterium GWF2_54_11 TaxID=1817851 RepID=A0A1F5R1V3_9BACT|nr:MAG: hypothetical protein A2502_02585 [Candidatus Edwardsbacteria bacterium RifOxyC12_full_54_24]OGF08464.1 MAG: hypothetical protein A2024_07095 [Candidatus Edwardsbacteria bacterium GWF2_54_11]OGF09140.1 MAG: hypothetical protein A2273_11040 [Candidatus Edwardsbacteria bacterium RifOxyA12_full_54_48]OGF12336.1 MAG: hypothetical protein A3K15_00555 [Candidatus Edwardsbacteria bacterium GWE2_54_12]OGF15709.1 MAG: hypothetical protein A2509_12300 [Candidatus Edwardsbacteria bacterium RIFOXYD1